MSNSKVYVGNLSYSVETEQLKELFSQYGEISDAVVIKDRNTGRSKGFGFVEMTDESQAQSAIDSLNGQEFEGRTLRVNIARPKNDKPRNDF